MAGVIRPPSPRSPGPQERRGRGIAAHALRTWAEAPTIPMAIVRMDAADPVPAPAPGAVLDAGPATAPIDAELPVPKTDQMVRSSLYLILSSGIQAGLGLLFWIITTRLFSTADVGRASSLISATTLIAFLALLGLNNAFVRYLPTASEPNALITSGLTLVAVAGGVIGFGYAALTPIFAPRLAFVGHRPALMAGFALLTAAAAVNLLTDSVFVATRKAAFNAVIDGGVGGVVKIACTVSLAGSGAYGLYCASTLGYLAAAAASVVLMAGVLRWRPSAEEAIRSLRPLLRFSGASYASNVLYMAPSLVVPLIVLDRLGASAAAYYFVAFQVATLLYSAAYAVEQAFLAEGSYAGAQWRQLLSRSLKVLAALCLPAALALVVAAHWILLIFGPAYSQRGTVCLMLLAVAALPIAANNWLATVLRLSGRLDVLVLSSAVYAVSICGLAWFFAPHGLGALTVAWPVGSALAAIVAATPRLTPARHERARPARSGLLAGRERLLEDWLIRGETRTAGAAGMTGHGRLTPQPLARILIVSAYAAPHIGGVEVVVGQQASTLAALGHEVTVATSRCGSGGSSRERVDGYTVSRVPAWNGLERRSGVPFPVWSPSALWRLSRLVRRADVVHIHDVQYTSSVLGAILAMLHRKPIFVTQHVALVEHDSALVMRIQRLAYALAGQRLWRWAETVTVYNPIVAEFVRSHGVPGQKVTLTYNGIDIRQFAPGTAAAAWATRQRYGLAPDIPVVLFVGRLVPKKGFQKLIEARSPEYQVVLVGPGVVPPHVPPGVRFLGPLDRTELRDLYRASDIFAFPAAGEMLTLAMQEAMACGLPIVAAAEEAYAQYGFDPAGIAFIRPEPRELRAAFLRILHEPGRSRYMRAYSRRIAEQCFDWRANAARHAVEYNSVYRPSGPFRPRSPRRAAQPAPPPRWPGDDLAPNTGAWQAREFTLEGER